MLASVVLAAAASPPALARDAAPSPAPPASSSPVPLASGPAPVRATLANGMRVVILPDALAPVVTTVMSYGVGAADDTMPGIAHATEHMLFRGTSRLSGAQLAELAARMGAEYNAQTLDTATIYWYKVPSAYADLVLRIEADRMVNATISASAWGTERGAIEQEIRARESSPSYRVGLRLRDVFFRGTPYADAGGGTVPSFEKMTADEIRAFYRAWYHPGNATLYVAGNVDPARTLAEIRKRFEAIPSAPTPAHAAVDPPPLASSTIEAPIDFPIGFAGLAYRFPGSTAPDYAAARVLQQVLGSGQGRLSDLSAEGKAVAVLSLANAFPQLGGAFFLGIPGPQSTPRTLQDAIRGVLADYRANGLPPALIDEAKLRLASQERYAQASISGLAFAWANATIQQTTPDALSDAIAGVTPDDVERVLRTYLTPDHEIAILLTAKPTTAVVKADAGAATEHVGFTPGVAQPLPAWANAALDVPLRVPDDERGTVVGKLPNGLRYAIRRETAAPTVTVIGAIRTSPELYAPRGKEGVDSILSGLLAYGTTTYDRKAYQAQFDAIAATGSVGTSFGLTAQAGDFERAMTLVADGMLHPALPADGFAVVKAALAQQVGVAAKLPQTKAAAAERDALYPPGDPRRRVATPSSVAAIGLDDVKAWYRTSFRPDETKIAIVGDVDPARAAAVLRAAFGAWKAAGPPPSFRFPKIAPRVSKAETVTVHSATNTLSEVSLHEVIPLKRRDADYVPMLLANVILSGEGTGSLLFEELRTRRGYVYSADSSVDVDQRGAQFSVSFASDPKNVDRADAAVVAIIKRLQQKPLPSADVQHAKALLLAQRVLPLDSYDGLAADLLAGATDGFDGVRERLFWSALLSTTPVQVQHALRRIDADRFLRVIVAPGA